MTHDTHVAPPAPGLAPDEFGLLAQLAFASRAGTARDSHAGRHLAFVSPDVLDMDLSDPLQCDFGDYELREKIGQGGMGMVYRAQQHSLDREVALKLLAAGPWASREFIERFRREAQSAARLEHPNIVTVYEAGTQHDLHYFSMRLVRGESLAARLLRTDKLAPRDAARLLLTVAEAVDYAHRLGVLHLDLKPGNVLIDQSGEPMVADFGLARRIDETLADEGDDVSGTPAYMAPEQATARSQQLGRATDIYGLGAILYECLTGRPPFLGPTPQATLERVVSDAVTRPRELERAIPPDLEAICLKCLAKEPALRYTTAAELRDDLRSFLDDQPVSVRLPDWHERLARTIRREPRVTAAVGAFVFALIVGLIASTQQWRRAEDNASTSRELLWEGRRERALQAELEGKGYESLALLVDNLREAEIAGADADVALDRRRIGMLRGQGAVLIDRIAIDDANPFALELSPDGATLAIAFNDLSVRWYDTTTLSERGRVSLAGRGSSSGRDRLPALLRFTSNDHLLLTLYWVSNLPSPADTDSWLIDLPRAAVLEPPPEFADFSDSAFAADGRHALLRNRRAQVQWWQTQPWKPLSPLSPALENNFFPWLLDPYGRFTLRSVRTSGVEFHALPSLQRTHSVSLPSGEMVSAWTLSHDGRTLALGDVEGGLFLYDLATREFRTLPSARGREATWIAFSEDDAWLAMAVFDGNVIAFDRSSGAPLHSGQLQHTFVPRRLGLSHAHRLLVVAGEGENALWRLPHPGPRAIAATRVGLPPAPHSVATQYSQAWSLDTGLFAGAGLDGQVRLWRLPPSPSVAALAPRQTPERQGYDGARLIDTEWNQLRLIAPDGSALTDWREYPQPPGFAQLVDHGHRLLITIGPELRFEDAVTGRPLAAPQALENSPLRMLVDPEQHRVLLAFGAHGENGYEERLRLFDVRSGQPLTGSAAIAAPVRSYAFSRDGARLLAVGPGHGATTVFATEGLEVMAEFPHDEFEPVQGADFAADGTILLVTRATDPRLGGDNLVRWDPARDEVRAEVALPQARPIAVASVGEGAFVAGLERDYAIDAQGRARALPRQSRDEAGGYLAHDPRGELLARGYRHEVQLHDAHHLLPLGPPLRSDMPATDGLITPDFSPDSTGLFATAVSSGLWLHWRIEPETRSVGALGDELAPLSPANENQRVLIAPTSSERLALRARDPGPWTAPTPRPHPATVRRLPDGQAIPARAPDLPAAMIDLSASYDLGPESRRNRIFNILQAMRSLPTGRQRIGGVDFDLRGMAQLMGDQGRSDGRSGLAQQTPLHGQTAPALYLLLLVSMAEPVAPDFVLGILRLHYVDGSSVELPLRAGRELPSYQGFLADAVVPLVFAPAPSSAIGGFGDEPLAMPRLQNPHPERSLHSLDLSPTDPDRPLLLLGITLETPDVISAARLGKHP